ANQVVLRVGDEDAVAIDAEVLGAVEGGQFGVTAIACGAGLASADHRANLPLAINDAQRVAAALEDINIPLVVGRDGAGIDQRRIHGLGAVLGHALLAVAGDGWNHASFHVDATDSTVVEIGDIHLLPLRIETDAVDAAKLRLRPRSAVACEALVA